MSWVPAEQLAELNYPDELNVSDALQQYFVPSVDIKLLAKAEIR
jgi:hypothetical protein